MMNSQGRSANPGVPCGNTSRDPLARASLLRRFATLVARQAWLRKAILGTPVLRDLAGRFVGGDDLQAGLAALHQLNSRGIKGTLNFFGMHALEAAEAAGATEQAILALQSIRDQGLDSHVSVKLTKIGFDLDADLCRAHLRRILEVAVETGGFVRIDMEESVYLEATLRLFEEMEAHFGGEAVGIVIQSYLRDRSRDLELLMKRGSRIRLVKGGYRESGEVVFTSSEQVDAAFMRDIERLLTRGTLPAIATHDEVAITWVKVLHEQLGLEKHAFEFQVLYGVKPELQQALAAEGYTVRCYVPYGGDWATHLVGCLRRLFQPVFLWRKTKASERPSREDPPSGAGHLQRLAGGGPFDP